MLDKLAYFVGSIVLSVFFTFASLGLVGFLTYSLEKLVSDNDDK